MFLTKLGLAKIQRDADRFFACVQAATVTLEWSETVGGTFNEAFKRYEGGVIQTFTLPNLKAEKIVVTETNILTLDIGGVKAGDVVFRFPANTDLEKPNLVIIHNQTRYYPTLYTPTKKDTADVEVGDTAIYQTITCSILQNRSLDVH